MDQADFKIFREKIRILERKLGILEDSEFTCCNMTLAQCHALTEIGRIGKVSLNELADLLNLESCTMSRTVDKLVKAGLTRREADQEDRRYVAISLTESGERLFREVETGMDSYFQEIFLQIPQGKRAQVLESLTLIEGAVTKSMYREGCCQ